MGFFNKIWSGLDFWNGDENRNQRDQRAQQEEEERKRREQLARERAFNAPRPNQPTQTQAVDNLFNLDQPLKKEGAFGTGFNNPILQPQKPVEQQPETPEQKNKRVLDDLTEANMERARADSEEGEGWIGRNLLNRKAIEERAKTLARSRATNQFQEKYGWNRDSAVLDYGKETSRQSAAEGERLRKQGADLDDFAGKMTKAGEIASYVPVTGSVMNLGLAGTEKLAKATGNEAYGKDLEDQRLQIDLGMTKDEFEHIDPETQQKLRNMQTLGLALSPLDFLGVGGLAKSGVVSAGKVAFKESIEGGLKKAAKETLKKSAVQAAKEAGVPAAVGAAASVGAQTYLGGTENIDPLEAAKTGLLVGGTSLLFPSQGVRAAGDEAVDNAVNGSLKKIDNVDEAAEDIKADIPEVEPGVKPSVQEAEDALIKTDQPQPTVEGKPAIEVEAGVKSTNLPTVPDVTNPVALAKADDMAGTAGDVPMADFSKPIDGSQLQKAPNPVDETIDQMAARAPTEAVDDLTPPGVVTEQSAVDVNGNPVLKSDAQVAKELAEAGIAPARGGSVAAATEDELQAAAAQAARDQVQTSSPASIREREAFASTEADEALAQEIIDTVPSKTPLNTEEMLSAARNNARAQTPEQLVTSWGAGRAIDQGNPQAWVNALEERKVLNAMVSENVPGAREARLNLADAMSQFQSKSGQNLNILKVAYDEMPADMKAELLIKKVDRARKQAGMDELNEMEMTELLARVETAEQANTRLKTLETDLADFNRSITQGSATPEARARLDELSLAREEALADVYSKNAVVTDYFSKVSPDGTFGQKLANWNRVSMLSSITGRIFDVASTSATTALDTVNRSLSSIIARGLNGRVGEGGAKTALPQVLPSAGDLRKAAGRTIDSAQGKNQVRDVMAEIQGMGTGRSELQNQSRGRFRNLVKAGTEAPTELTRYIEDNEIRRAGFQRAVDELGLKGDDADLYADSYASVATTNEKYAAQQEHLKANMLHNNVVSSKVDAVANTLLNSSSDAGKTAGAILKSVVAPFTRFIGGMTHRTFTDMNVIHNVWEMRKAVKNGDTQLLADSMAKATTNLGVGFATATVLAESGILVDHDANGDSYAGLYFHVGDRYIPVGFAGLASVPMIVGYGLNQASNAENPADAFTAATTDTLSRVLASTGTAGFFGADNALQSAVSGASSAISPGDSNTDERNWADVVGSMVRQSIPGGLNDVNAVLNQFDNLNPTGEAAETKVLTEDGKQDPLATQIAKTQNVIPGLSQMLPRREGTVARDLIDRSTKGNRESGEMKEGRETKENLADWKKRLEDEGAPVTAEKISDLAKTGDFDKALAGAEYRLAELEADKDATENSKINARREIEDYKFGQQYKYTPSSNEAVETRAEKGDYDAAIAGWQLRMKRDEEEGNTPESKLDSQRRKIQRYEVFRDMDVPTGVVTAYEKSESDSGGVGVTAWRDMMDSGDPKLVAYAEQLYNLDKALVDKGAVKEPKYYWGKGGRGGGSGSKPRFATDIGTLDAGSYSFAPSKAQGATFGQPNSSIPKLQKTPDYSRKPKKISVKRGNKV